MESKAEFGAQQFAAGYANGCADRDELIEALSDLLADSDDTDDGVIPTISSATLVRARAALAKARGQKEGA